MAVASRAVQGRRKLRFETMDQFMADVEQLVAAPQVKMLGNWSLSELLSHLALAVNGSIDGIPQSDEISRILRLLGPLIKGRVLRKGLPVGFKLPKKLEVKFFPTGTSAQQAFGKLQQAVLRLQNEKMTATHIVFGKLTHAEWIQFHLRHAELHLSFAALPTPSRQVVAT